LKAPGNIYLVLTLAVLCRVNTPAQSKLDSLREQLRAPKNDTTAVFILSLMGDELYLSEPDSAIFYWQRAKKICETKGSTVDRKRPEYLYFKKNEATLMNNIGYLWHHQNKDVESMDYYLKSLEIYTQLGLKPDIVTALINIGQVYGEQGKTAKALDFFERGLKIARSINDKKGISILLNNMGLIFEEKGDIQKALEYYFEAIKMDDELNDKKGVIATLNNIAIIYEGQGDIEKAIEYYDKGLKAAEEVGDKLNVAHLLSNIAGLYDDKKEHDKALSFFQRSLKVMNEMGDRKGTALVLGNIALVYKETGRFNEALEQYTKSLKLKQELNDKGGMCVTLNNIGALYKDKKEYKRALDYSLQSLALAKETAMPRYIRSAAELSYNIQKFLGLYKEALANYELCIKMKDSVNNERTRKASIKSQLKYEYEKQAAADSVAHAKESEIKNAELKRQEAEIKAKKNQQYALFGGLFLVGLFSIFMYNRFKVTQKQKVVIEHQKEIVEEQKKLVEEKQLEILDSIKYAKRIQIAQIPTEKRIFTILKRMQGPEVKREITQRISRFYFRGLSGSETRDHPKNISFLLSDADTK
jgi:tetratricopeptide (TPR) repeat protein